MEKSYSKDSMVNIKQARHGIVQYSMVQHGKLRLMYIKHMPGYYLNTVTVY